MQSKNPKLITVAEAAQMKGVSRSAVYQAIQEGRLPSTVMLGRVALAQADVDNWVPKSSFGRRKGQHMSEEGKARIAAGQKRRWAKRKAS